MQEIKFRVWDKSQKCFLSWSEVLYTEQLSDAFLGKANVAQQYTTLSDKNGKEIYDGDILSYGPSYIGVVAWHEGEWHFIYKKYKTGRKWNDIKKANDVYKVEEQSCPSWCFKECVIIGNIFENSDLLKV